MKRLGILAVLAACGGGDDGEPPLAQVEMQLEGLAVNDASIFAIDTQDNKVVEINLVDGSVKGKLPSNGAVSEVVAAGAWVAWIEAEGTGKVIMRRKADGTTIESTRAVTATPKILAAAEGLFYS